MFRFSCEYIGAKRHLSEKPGARGKHKILLLFTGLPSLYAFRGQPVQGPSESSPEMCRSVVIGT